MEEQQLNEEQNKALRKTDVSSSLFWVSRTNQIKNGSKI